MFGISIAHSASPVTREQATERKQGPEETSANRC